MTIRRLALASALALLPTAALAGSAATVSADYTNYDFYGAGFSANSWGGDASGAMDLSGSWRIEGDADYHHASTSGFDFNHWGFSGNAFWQGNMGRAGLSLGYNSSDGAGFNIHGFNYGVAGEYWASPAVTIAVKGGGLTGTSGVDGYYAGLKGTAYFAQNFSLSGSIDYTHLNAVHETDLRVEGEWLVSQTAPVSVFAGYQNGDFTGGLSDVNVWFVGLRLYCNDPPGGTLVDRQRSGTLGWAGSISPVALRF
jgi:hypothetical protein